MKTTTTLILAAALVGSQAHADILASWRPVPEANPGGAQYANTLTSPVAEVSVPEFLQAIASRANSGNNGNAGAVWPGSADSTELDPAAYTSFTLEVPSDAAVDFDSFSYVMNTYGFERETLNPGTPEEEVVLSVLQLRLRSSLDNFQSDLASATSLPTDRVESNNLNFTFDLREATDLQNFSGAVEFRLYIWEESEVAGYNPFTWIDMATGGATFEGIVTDTTEIAPIARNPLVEIFPEPKPEAGGLPANTTAVAPTLVTLAPEIGSVEALRIGHENFGNRAAVWPGRVSSLGFDEFSYLEVTITPGPGATFSIAEFVIPQINTYATDDGGAWQAAIRSNLDDFSEDLATTSGAGTYRVQFNLAGEASLRNIATPLTFRVYLWETALVEGITFNPQMWFDIAGNATGTAPGIQVIGEAQLGSIGNPLIASALYLEGTGFQIEAVDLTPGRSYDIAVTFDLSEPFTPLELEQTATGTTLTFVDGFADSSIDSKAFYRLQEVVPR
jgi:hypothetical protein